MYSFIVDNMLNYCHRNGDKIRAKDAESKREKRAMVKAIIIEEGEGEVEVEEDEEDEEDSDFQPSSVLPPSDPPSPSPPLTPRLTDSPYDAYEQAPDDDDLFNRPAAEYESSSRPGTPFPVNAHDRKQADLNSLNTLRVVREAMVEWMVLGPVKDWTATFRTAYDQAAAGDHGDTQEAIDIFLQGVAEHVRQGKQMLVELGRTSFVRMEKGDRLMAGDMQETLHRGVAILEAHLSLTAPSGPLPSDSLSTIRAYKGFAEDY